MLGRKKPQVVRGHIRGWVHLGRKDPRPVAAESPQRRHILDHCQSDIGRGRCNADSIKKIIMRCDDFLGSSSLAKYVMFGWR